MNDERHDNIPNKDKIKGTLFIVSAPSGAGKTSLLSRCLNDNPHLSLSVSHTTRAPREGEQDGKEYHFVDTQAFESMASEGHFLESAQVFGNYYGTSHIEAENQLNEGKDVVLEIDWQGAQQVRKQFKETVSIFIVPPSLSVLKQRLTDRGLDDDEVIQARLSEAREEISHYLEFDYLVVNDDFENAAKELNAIFINALVLKKAKSEPCVSLVAELLDPLA
jgi:guanylate kinase